MMILIRNRKYLLSPFLYNKKNINNYIFIIIPLGRNLPHG